MVAPAVGCTLVLTDRQLLLVRDGHSFRPRSGIQRWVVDRSLSVRLGPVRQTTGQLAIECCGRTASVFLHRRRHPGRRCARRRDPPPDLPPGLGAAVTRAPRGREHRIRQRRPGLERPRPELAVGQRHERRGRPPGRPTGTSPTHRNGRTSPGCSASPSSAATWRRAARTRGPSRADRTSPTPGSTPSSPGKTTDVAVANSWRVTRVGRRSSAASLTRSASGPCRPCDGRSRSVVAPHPERVQDRAARRAVSTAVPDRSATSAPERVEARVRIDPPAAGCRDRLGTLERQPRGVGQQVTHRRARRSRRLVELDPSRASTATSTASAVDELGDRRPAERVPGIASLVASTPSGPTTAAAALAAPQPSIRARASSSAVIAEAYRPPRRPTGTSAAASLAPSVGWQCRAAVGHARRHASAHAVAFAPPGSPRRSWPSPSCSGRRDRSRVGVPRRQDRLPQLHRDDRRRRRRRRRASGHRVALLDRQELPGPRPVGGQDLRQRQRRRARTRGHVRRRPPRRRAHVRPR